MKRWPRTPDGNASVDSAKRPSCFESPSRENDRVRLFAVLAALATLALACEPPARSPLTGSSPLVPIFESAGREFDVPPQILVALAYHETGLQPVPTLADDSDRHVPASYGLMGLPEFGGRSVARAARLLHLDVELVKSDLETNIRGAAALLQGLRDDRPIRDLSVGALSDWAPIIEAYLDAGPIAAAPVLGTLAQGLHARDESGWLSFEPAQGEFGTSSLGLAGEYPGSTFVSASSANYTNSSRTGADIDVIVIHTVQGSYAGCISWFQNSDASVSAHYVVRRSDGAITQMVHHEDRAWHAGNSEYNRRSIGIEHEGFIDRADNYTDPMLESSAALVRWLAADLGIPLDRDHIIGHIEVPRATHTDPGPHWPWDRFMALVTDGTPVNPPPPTDRGVLQGVVFQGSNIDERVPGAAVRLEPSGATATADPDGFWSFQVAPGTYTVTAEAAGFEAGTTVRTVAAGASVWGSVSLSPLPAGKGTLAGVVFDATLGEDSRVEGALVRVEETGSTQTTESTGLFELELDAGTYRVSVSKEGFEPSNVSRVVNGGRVSWGSVGIVPIGAPMPNRPPDLPRLDEPIAGTPVRSAMPIFRVGALTDPENDPIEVDVEIYADPTLATRISRGSVSAGTAGSATWRHPLSDLPRGIRLYWRARAKDATLTSPWTAPESFFSPVDGEAPVPTAPWTAPLEPRVTFNRAPLAPRVLSPLDGVVVGSTQPDIVGEPASDPDGDELAYQFQLGLDDVYRNIEETSTMVAGSSTVRWKPTQALAAGSTYYVRARAADARVFGPWSESRIFSISTEATTPGAEGDFERDLGDDANERRRGVTRGGCDCRAHGSRDPTPLVALLLFAITLRRRAR